MPRIRLLAVVGACFCLYNLYGPENAVCLSTGCRVFHDFAPFGVPMWALGFCAFGCLALFPRYWFCALLVAADCVLLALMLLGSPCVNCLLAGLLMVGMLGMFPRENIA